MFDPERLSTSPAVFDSHKLKWMNNQYIKSSSLDRVIQLAKPHLLKAGKIEENADEETEKWVNELIGLYKEQLSYGAEIVELTELFFKKEAEYTEEAMDVLSQEHVPEMLANFKTQLDGLELSKRMRLKPPSKHAKRYR